MGRALSCVLLRCRYSPLAGDILAGNPILSGPVAAAGAAASAAAAAGNGTAGGAAALAASATNGSGWCIFVYNLAPETEENILWQLFGPFGAVQVSGAVFGRNYKRQHSLRESQALKSTSPSSRT